MNKKLLLIFLLIFLPLIALAVLLLFIRSPKTPNPPAFTSISPLTSRFFPPPKTITLVAVGDIMLGRYVNITSRQNKDYRYPFLKTADFLNQANITFGNLESPLVGSCPETAAGMVFCAPSKAVDGLIYAGFNILSIANNHILNYGKDGRQKTIELLEQNEIIPSFENLIIKEINNLKFGFLSFDLVTYPNTPVAEEVKKNILQADILIVSLHWGNEYEKEPRDWQKKLAHEIIDAGAKIIIGHHPHVVQPVERYQNGLVFYSLGNFVFDQPWSEETKKSQIAKVVFTGKEIEGYELSPIYIKNSQPFLAD